MKATKRLINKVWTLEYEVVSEDTVRILRISDCDLGGYRNEHSLPRLSFDEDADRTVVGVWIQEEGSRHLHFWADRLTAKYYKVSNPKHIFAYGASRVLE